MSSREFPDVIDLVETSDGVFMPGVVNTPTTGAIVPYRAAPIELYPVPSSPPRYQSGSRGLSDADLADFGVDSRGRPVVVRDAYGRAQFNPDVDYEGRDFDSYYDPADTLDSLPDSRRARNRVGTAMDFADRAGQAAELADAFDLFHEESGIHPLGPHAGLINDLWNSTDVDERGAAAVASWLNRGLDLINPDRRQRRPSGYIRTEGPAPFQGGQCEIFYNIMIAYTSRDGIGGPEPGTPIGPYQLRGPIEGFYTPSGGSGIFIQHNGGQHSNIAGSGSVTTNQPYFVSINVAVGGQVDDCGDPPGITTDTPVAPTGTQPSTDYPPSDEPKTDYPDAPRVPDAPGEYEPPPEPPASEYPELPEVPELPEEPEPEDRPDPPTPAPDCCPSTERSLDDIKADLEQILEKLQGSGDGALDLTPCDEDTTVAAEYEGEGLAGVYSALSAIEQSLNFIAGNTKCPPDGDAVLPMAFEVKRGEIPQLVVSWRKVEGTDSKWSMTIPHPSEIVTADYAFDFPTYLKGPTTCTFRLTDNSHIIVNAANEAEGTRVIDYCLTLIDQAYLPTERRVTITKHAADFQEVEVKAVHVKSFRGHKNTTPLWAKRLTS